MNVGWDQDFQKYLIAEKKPMCDCRRESDTTFALIRDSALLAGRPAKIAKPSRGGAEKRESEKMICCGIYKLKHSCVVISCFGQDGITHF
ncbi:hypothetical protein TNCV_4756141 [Trichonephila clavipes]|nr:hypothetical protein TNCV_4756141 [Trichonephila clavipes]